MDIHVDIFSYFFDILKKEIKQWGHMHKNEPNSISDASFLGDLLLSLIFKFRVVIF
jgi:hypothetical protein